MKFESLSLVSVSGLLLVLSVGCASDPNKQVQSAETNLTSEQQKAQADQAALDRKQSEERSKSQEKSTDTQVEMQRDHQSQQAETRAGSTTSVSGAQKDVVDAHANMTQDRRDFDAKVQDRMDKADAKEKELKAKSKKLDAKKSTEFNANYKRYTAARADAGAKAKTLKTTSNESWTMTKDDVSKKLDEMESALDKMGQNF